MELTEREGFYFLQSVEGIGNVTIGRLLKEFGGVVEACEGGEGRLTGILNKAQLNHFLTERETADWKRKIEELGKRGVFYYSIADGDYPKRLKKIPGAPYGIFVKGMLPPEGEIQAAVIGTRNHSGYGESMAKEYGKILALCGIGVVSGMAKGIDGIAQRSALHHGGHTYGVLGCGVDICYPPENRGLYERIPENGALISEYMPDTVPRAGLFPQRNRIISGLSDMVLVIEAREKSGTLITVDMALEQGREIYALPGRVTDPLSLGCNRLIRQGAGILPEPDTFYKELQEEIGIKHHTASKMEDEIMSLTELERAVLVSLDDNPITGSQLLGRMQEQARQRGSQEIYHIQDISVCLITLCMKKLARQVNGTMFMKNAGE